MYDNNFGQFKPITPQPNPPAWAMDKPIKVNLDLPKPNFSAMEDRRRLDMAYGLMFIAPRR